MIYTPRLHVRPWPVSPKEYPLSGPSSGPVYTPPQRSLWRDVAFVLALLAIAAFGVAMRAHFKAHKSEYPFVACTGSGGAYLAERCP